ncbi:MAG: ethanolamine utilization protein EutH [Methanosarcinales archaeon]|jgi:ethanolamine transporter|nr:ethanolamine utilization protein EutH [Methanosarcinales archaeon]
MVFTELIESVTNIEILTASLSHYAANLSVSGIVMTLLSLFMLLGVYDKLRGGKLGYGEQFDRGFKTMGDLALSIVGIIALSPVLLLVLSPIAAPVYNLIGASPAMFPGSLLAVDMGGYAMALQMAENPAIGNYSGLIVASMMGITLSFTIPYALSILDKKNHPLFATGILLGIVTLPVGCLAGGLAMNFTSTPLTAYELLINTLPVILLAVLVGVGLIVKQSLMLKLFEIFGKAVTFIAVVSPGIAIFQYLTDIRLPLFYLMVEEDPGLGGIPLEVGLLIIGLIAIVLAGAFPMVLFLKRRLGKWMERFGGKAGINSEASAGLLTQLANNLPVWDQIKNMDNQGKLLNVVFTVSAAFVFGDVLAFVGGVNSEMVFPVITAKLTGGILAVFLTLFLLKKNVLKAGKNDANPADADTGRAAAEAESF